MRKNSKTRSAKNIQEHYDLSNDFFELLLDDTMMYSSAVFEKPVEPLFEAQKRFKSIRNWFGIGSYGYALSKRVWL